MEDPNELNRIPKTIFLKLNVVEHFKKSQNVSETAREFNIERKSVRFYVKQEEKLRTAPRKRKNSRLKNNKPLHPECESQLISWFREQRLKRVCVSGNELKAKMLKLVESGIDEHNFKASTGWLFNFTRRFRLSRRRITTSGRDFPTNSKEIISDHVANINDYIEDKNYTLSEIAQAHLTIYISIFFK